MSNTSFLLLTAALLAGWFGCYGISDSAAAIAQLCLVGFSILFVLDLKQSRRVRA